MMEQMVSSVAGFTHLHARTLVRGLFGRGTIGHGALAHSIVSVESALGTNSLLMKRPLGTAILRPEAAMWIIVG
jgi:hypothetical protein